MAARAYCPAVNPEGPIWLLRGSHFSSSLIAYFAKAGLRINENTFQSIPCKPNLDIMKRSAKRQARRWVIQELTRCLDQRNGPLSKGQRSV
jgi:hypothetical protein